MNDHLEKSELAKPAHFPPVWTKSPHLRGIAFCLTLLMIIGLGIACRTLYFSSHFTHIDDIGVAATLLRNSAPDDVRKTLESRLSVSSDSPMNNPRTHLLNQLHETFLWPLCNTILIHTYKYFCIPLEWTYAPVQFFVTAALVHPGDDYQSNITKGRLPSLIFGILTAPAIFFMITRIRGPTSISQGLLASFIMAFSLENIVFSMHMSNYALGPLVIIGLFILLIVNIQNPSLSLARAFLNGFVLSFLFLCHYQAFIFVPAFLAALLILLLRHPQQWPQSLRSIFITSTIFAAFFIPVYVFRFSDTTPAYWSCGPEGQFLFSCPSEKGALPALAYTAKFFAINGYIVFSCITAFIPEGSPLFHPIATLLMISAFTGLFAFSRSTIIEERFAALFIFISALFWVALVTAQKLTLSPTRHTLVLLPIFAILSARGIVAFTSTDRIRNLTTLLIPLFSAILFLVHYPSFMSTRQNHLNEKRIFTIIQNHNVHSILSYMPSPNLSLMPALTGLTIWEIDHHQPFPAHLWKPGSSLAFFSDTPLTPSVIAGLAQGMPQGAKSLDQLNSLPRVSYQEDYVTDTEFEMSKRTISGANRHSMAILLILNSGCGSDQNPK